ncbi:transposase domain-containing protein [uncultured Maricaulis sp.]|uniref:transposase domain-containing protein n=1 Tax=uncultured Maricaulis sp. TaxID=174710 RepID=UPI0030D7F718|tara:strand:- start:149542 stop:151473 length:1932 start_codon:yes stop_codon:yes gene_type:complete
MREWFTIADVLELDIAGAPVSTKKGWNGLVIRSGWRDLHERARQGSRGWEYHISLWPLEVRGALMRVQAQEMIRERALVSDTEHQTGPKWDHFRALSEKHRNVAADRLAAVEAFNARVKSGASKGEAFSEQAAISGVSIRSLQRWWDSVRSVPHTDWLPTLAPGYRPTAQFGPCHPKALETIKADFLRPEKPSFNACYRRLKKLAEANGWSPIPSSRAMRRRLGAEVQQSVVAIRREGRDMAKALYPAQLRVKNGLHAMQVVNMDGHRFDVMVKRPDGKVFRPVLTALQDVYSGKFVGWRIDETENKVAVRLAIGDMIEHYGIPEHIVLDNGRSFASKWITGGQKSRYRFKIRDDEPDGLLTLLGVKVHWAKPYSGQSKPIERAFRDLCDDIARHPVFHGAYTGNSPTTKPDNYGARAVDYETFRRAAHGYILEHNARTGRNTSTTQGRSFDATFEASMNDAATVVRRAAPAQRSLWLLMAEAITARKPSGEIHLMGNRYWSEAMVEHAGKKVCVRFDPDDLARPVEVFAMDGVKLCDARAIEEVNFLDADAARRHEKARSDFLKTQRELAKMHVKLSPEELARLYAPPMADQTKDPIYPAVTRLASAEGRTPPPDERAEWTDEDEAAFVNVVGLMGRRLMRD